jgi:hypothetical protein
MADDLRGGEQERLIPLSLDAEQRLRQYLWLGHGHSGVYGDDGEMQCSQCLAVSRMYDYKRTPLEQVIDAAIAARREVNLQALFASSTGETAAPTTQEQK